ncbi:MAG: putative monovalent cation/H+ antiporter subunit A [Armatimonadetes bacterium]|nr:putative monovalent cation/H+ antiporter subunit A [Armatimonadota bacterium]
MTVAVLSGFVLALAAPWLVRATGRAAGWVTALLPLALTVYFGSLLGQIGAGDALNVTHSWIPALGMQFSLYLDGLGLLFALLICGIGTLIFIYSGGYLPNDPHLGRFLSMLLLFMGAMLGLVLADNVIVLFVFWELTSISSYFLIGFQHSRPEARAAALQALLVTGVGGVALLLGVLLLGQVGGSLELSTLLGRGNEIRAHPLYLPILVLVLLGAFTKSAQVPFHFWLPAAMEAPTPVSAYLHSATMVKAGVYLLARMSPILGGTDPWVALVTTVGAVTMLAGGTLALLRTDLKQILAYTTVAALGTLTMLLGMGTADAARACMTFLLAHAFYKGALFLGAGSLEHGAGSRDVDHLGGLWRTMPLTTAAAGLAALALAGFGPVLSFIGKELLLEAVLAQSPTRALLAPAVLAGSALSVAAAAIVGLRPFAGTRPDELSDAQEAPASLWLGPVVLAAGGVVLGLRPEILAEPIVTASAASVLTRREVADLALWHGPNPALAFSGASLVLGLLVYRAWPTIRRSAAARTWWLSWGGPSRWYELGLQALSWLAESQTRLLQSGYLRLYLIMILITANGLAAYALLARVRWQPIVLQPAVQLHDAFIGALILLGALAAAGSASRLGAVAALGVVGAGISLVYISFGAPDLAMTQFLVEAFTVILLVLAFYHLPRFARLSGRTARLRDVVIAGVSGTLVAALVLLTTTARRDSRIAEYFAEHSVAAAHGRNIVNVILVDFRSLDTLGEITVLATAAIGVYVLLRLRPEKGSTP